VELLSDSLEKSFINSGYQIKAMNKKNKTP